MIHALDATALACRPAVAGAVRYPKPTPTPNAGILGVGLRTIGAWTATRPTVRFPVVDA